MNLDSARSRIYDRTCRASNAARPVNLSFAQQIASGQSKIALARYARSCSQHLNHSQQRCCGACLGHARSICITIFALTVHASLATLKARPQRDSSSCSPELSAPALLIAPVAQNTASTSGSIVRNATGDATISNVPLMPCCQIAHSLSAGMAIQAVARTPKQLGGLCTHSWSRSCGGASAVYTAAIEPQVGFV